MKKLILLFLLFVGVSDAFYCSSSAEDGGPLELGKIESKAESELAIITKMWESIRLVSEKIKTQAKNKQQYLQNITNLTKANAIKEQKIQFEYERYKQLLGIYNDMTGSVNNER